MGRIRPVVTPKAVGRHGQWPAKQAIAQGIEPRHKAVVAIEERDLLGVGLKGADDPPLGIVVGAEEAEGIALLTVREGLLAR